MAQHPPQNRGSWSCQNENEPNASIKPIEEALINGAKMK